LQHFQIQNIFSNGYNCKIIAIFKKCNYLQSYAAIWTLFSKNCNKTNLWLKCFISRLNGCVDKRAGKIHAKFIIRVLRREIPFGENVPSLNPLWESVPSRFYCFLFPSAVAGELSTDSDLLLLLIHILCSYIIIVQKYSVKS
jgi:hypothetical protein